jgi:hypothetical protein
METDRRTDGVVNDAEATVLDARVARTLARVHAAPAAPAAPAARNIRSARNQLHQANAVRAHARENAPRLKSRSPTTEVLLTTHASVPASQHFWYRLQK